MSHLAPFNSSMFQVPMVKGVNWAVPDRQPDRARPNPPANGARPGLGMASPRIVAGSPLEAHGLPGLGLTRTRALAREARAKPGHGD